MQIIIEAPFTVNPAMKDAIHNKLKGFTKYEDKINQANVFFKLDDGVSPNNILAEIRLRIPGNDLFASASSDVDMTAFTLAANQTKSQLLKRKEIIQNHR